MSRQTLAETLKGGTLLLGILMLLLMIAGGLLKLVLGDAPRGPEYKVQVRIDPAAARMRAPAGNGPAAFAIPDGAVDVAGPTHVGPDGLAGRPGVDSAGLIRAGFRSLDCRTFAWDRDRNATVTACMTLFDSAAGAFSIYSTGRPNPDSLAPRDFARGYITPEGFKIVKGRACFEIVRSGSDDAARQLALSFLDRLGTQDFGPDVSDQLARLPRQGMVPGTEQLTMAPARDRPPALSARYRFDGVEVSGSLTVMESEQAAVAATDASAANLVARGAARTTPDGGPRGTWFFVDGQLPVAVGSAGAAAFRIDGTAGITAVVKAAQVLAGIETQADQ